jgi:hypothetical protein
MLPCNVNDYVEQVGTGATWCIAHMKLATVGLFMAVVTPSQIVVTAAAVVVHTASIKSQHALALPAIDISCCAILTWRTRLKTR